MSIGLKPQTVKFYERQGIKFFEDFVGVDKFKKPIKIGFDSEPDTFAVIKAAEGNSDELAGTCSLLFEKDKSLMECTEILVDKERRNVGQMLTLSSLIEFAQNRLNHLKLFSLKEALAFHSRFGFIIENDDPYYLSDALRQVVKSKAPHSEEFKRDAGFFFNKVRQCDQSGIDDLTVYEHACKVISGFMKYLSRNGMKKYMPVLENGSHMKFTDLELVINKDYLNKLLEQHNIDYKF